jgi:glycosyltransferase involved in cell wall biosynthesis
MKVLWFTWKNRRHPLAGGAELVNEELAKRLAAAGHEVRFVVAGFQGATREERRDGFSILRLGHRWSLYLLAWREYGNSLKGWADVVVDEMNTIPFFCKLFVEEPNILFVHQLCRKVWWYEMPFPLSAIGYFLEPLYLRFLNDRQVATVSESTKQDLLRYGFRAERISILPQGIATEPLQDLSEVRKDVPPTMLCLGSLRAMKRTLQAIRTFEIAKAEVPDLLLVVAGDAVGRYGRKVLDAIARSPQKDAIRYEGRVDGAAKIALLRAARVLCVPSVKEGWGLVVTEAAAQGTPAVVYDVDGLRDSVRNGETGIIAKDGDLAALAEGIVRLFKDDVLYERVRQAAWIQASTRSFDRTAEVFLSFLTAV